MNPKVTNQYGVVIDYEVAEHLMDDDLREEFHQEMAPCTEQEFFDAHAKRYEEKYAEVWVLDTQNPQY